MIAVVSQGTQESREAARRVMAWICPGAVEIAPGSWRHRITHAEPSPKHSTGGGVIGANSSAARGNAHWVEKCSKIAPCPSEIVSDKNTGETNIGGIITINQV